MGEANYPTCRLNKEIEVTGLHTAFIKDMVDNYTSRGEFHNFWELALVLDGSVYVTTDKMEFFLEKHTMVLHPPMEFHRHFNATGDQSRFAVLSFDAAVMPDVSARVFGLTPKQCDQLCSLIRYIEESCEMQDKLAVLRSREDRQFAQQEIKSRLELFLLSVFRGKTLARRSRSPEYERIVSYLGSVLEENRSLSQLALGLGMSPSSLKRIFSEYGQTGIMRYYRQMRMYRAVELLKEGGSVREVSEQMNFSSQSAFCNAFKRILGEPPSKYQRSGQ